MDSFSIGGAWSRGFRFLGGRFPAHAAFLIAGALLAVGVEYAILGVRLAESGRAPVPWGSRLFDYPDALLVMGLGYLFQIGSYFACWRLGFDERRSVPGALVFGPSAGLIAVFCLFLAYVLASYLWLPLLAPDTAFLAILVFLLPLIVASALFMIAAIAFVAGAIIVFLVFAMVYGAAMGQVSAAATLVGGSGAVTVLLLVLAGFTFWLAGRFSCVTSVMADRQSLNLFAAIAESWRLTLDEQWAITRYLALVGGIPALLLLGAILVIGTNPGATMPGVAMVFTGTTGEIVGLVIAIGFGFLAVAVPAGIYRQLVGEEVSTEVFD